MLGCLFRCCMICSRRLAIHRRRCTKTWRMLSRSISRNHPASCSMTHARSVASLLFEHCRFWMWDSEVSDMQATCSFFLLFNIDTSARVSKRFVTEHKSEPSSPIVEHWEGYPYTRNMLRDMNLHMNRAFLQFALLYNSKCMYAQLRRPWGFKMTFIASSFRIYRCFA